LFPKREYNYIGYGVSSYNSLIYGSPPGSCTNGVTGPAVTVYYGSDSTVNYCSTYTITSNGNWNDMYIYTSVPSAGFASGGNLIVVATLIYNPLSLRPLTSFGIYLYDYRSNLINY
jgi:hypothetical protein